jgi:N-acetylmuramoyl-L-alanine amidase
MNFLKFLKILKSLNIHRFYMTFICITALLILSASVVSPVYALEAGSDNAPAFNVVTLPGSSVPYVSIIELADAYNVTVTHNPVMLSMTARRGNNSLRVLNQSTIAIYNTDTVNIVFPARLIQGAMYIPVTTALPLFSNLINGTLTWDSPAKRIVTTGILYNIDKISLENREGGTLIGFTLKEPLDVTDELVEIRPDGSGEINSEENSEDVPGEKWLHIGFADGTCNPDSVFANLSAEKKGIIEEIRLSRNSGETRFSFKVSDVIESYSIAKSTEPHEILISLRHKRIIETPEPVVVVPDIPLPGLELSKDLWTIDTVVIDPGHGGKDPGTVGPNGTYEKDIVLKIAKELKKIIDERKEVKAVLTRDRDVFIPLRQRAEIADKANGKLFISIHVNAHRNKRASGLEAYFLSEARTENAQRVADRENASALLEENPEYYSEESNIFLKIFSDMQSNVFLKESQYMCQLLLDKTKSATKQKSRGVKQGVYYVLLGTQAVMPSVLFEIGYISNANEGKLIKRGSNQNRIAQSIYDAIIDFKKQAERDLMTRGE